MRTDHLVVGTELAIPIEAHDRFATFCKAVVEKRRVFFRAPAAMSPSAGTITGSLQLTEMHSQAYVAPTKEF